MYVLKRFKGIAIHDCSKNLRSKTTGVTVNNKATRAKRPVLEAQP